MTTNDNMLLWDSVSTTDPSHTKQFKRGGGFSGTAINAVYSVRKATKQWGPIGGSWGYTIVKEEYVNGAPIIIDGVEVAKTIIHVLWIELFHPGGKVPSVGQTTFVGRQSSGIFTDEEAPKKSLTDALTKALSWLGFSADVFLGLYDDSKYVAGVRQAMEESKQQEQEEKQQAAIVDMAKVWIVRYDSAVAEGKSVEELRDLVNFARSACVLEKQPGAWKRILEHVTPKA